MSRIVINDEQKSQIIPEGAANEVFDSSGNLVGYFVDAASYEKFLNTWEKEYATELAELDRRVNDGDFGTLQELWKELGVQ